MLMQTPNLMFLPTMKCRMTTEQHTEQAVMLGDHLRVGSHCESGRNTLQQLVSSCQGGHSAGKPGKVGEFQSSHEKVREGAILHMVSYREY